MSSDDADAAESVEAIDVVVAANYLDGWEVTALPADDAVRLDRFLDVLRRYPSEVGTIGMVSVDEDFFVIARVAGTHVRLLLSDAGAAVESPLAASVLEALGLPMPDDDDDDVQPAGDLRILADLGASPSDVAILCDDLDLYPDEVLSRLGHRSGFGAGLDEILDAVAPA